MRKHNCFFHPSYAAITQDQKHSKVREMGSTQKCAFKTPWNYTACFRPKTEARKITIDTSKIFNAQNERKREHSNTGQWQKIKTKELLSSRLKVRQPVSIHAASSFDCRSYEWTSERMKQKCILTPTSNG